MTRVQRCPFPWKQQLTAAEAEERAAHLNRKVPGSSQPYACPAGGHSHVGSPRAKRLADRRRRRKPKGAWT